MAKKNNAAEAIEILKFINGLGKEFIILSQKDKELIAKMPEKKNVINLGVREALSREITIAFSHNEKFRPPPCAIVIAKESGGCILPPVPFPELDAAFSNVCSASPGYLADAFLRTLIEVEKNGATLLVGFNLKR